MLDKIKISNRTLVLIIFCLVTVVIIDTSISTTSSFVGGLGSNFTALVGFSLIIFIYSIGQFFILKSLGFKVNTVDNKDFIKKLHKIIQIIQLILIGILIIIIMEMIYFQVYSTILLKIIIWINFFLSAVLFGYFGIRLFIWNWHNKNLILVLFAMAMLALSTTCMITVSYTMYQLGGQRGFESVFPMKSVQIIIAGANNTFSTSFQVASIVSFVLTWLASVALFRSMAVKIGRFKFWILVIMPLAYFLSQFHSFFPFFFAELRDNDPILYSLVYTLFANLSKPVGGILFGLSIWNIARNLNDTLTKGYITIAACGMMLFFTVNQPSSLTLFPYPPFGVPTICLVGLASYLILIGIYSSSISISSNREILRAIRRSIPNDSDLLGSIVSAKEIQKMQHRAFNIANDVADKITKETGIHSSIEESDIKNYLLEVLEEVKKSRGS